MDKAIIVASGGPPCREKAAIIMPLRALHRTARVSASHSVAVNRQRGERGLACNIGESAANGIRGA
jgi:hypothetical protein